MNYTIVILYAMDDTRYLWRSCLFFTSVKPSAYFLCLPSHIPSFALHFYDCFYSHKYTLLTSKDTLYTFNNMCRIGAWMCVCVYAHTKNNDSAVKEQPLNSSCSHISDEGPFPSMGRLSIWLSVCFQSFSFFFHGSLFMFLPPPSLYFNKLHCLERWPECDLA